VKTKITKFRRAAAEGAEGLEDLALVAVSGLDRAVSKGVLHANNAARRKSRLAKRLRAAGETQAAPAAAPTAKSRGTAVKKTTTRTRAATKR
jgi:hypothetical protein